MDFSQEQNVYNCHNCKFAEKVDSEGNVSCDKREFEGIPEIIIKADKTDINCPAHSDLDKFVNSYESVRMSSSEEYCSVCHRKLVNKQMADIDAETKSRICIKCASKVDSKGVG